MKTAFFLLLVGCCQAHAAITIEAPRQRGEIQCKQVLELKDIFDGGFRPYRIIESKCAVGKADAILLMPSSNLKTRLDVEMMSFTISRHDTVKRIDIRTTAAPVKQTGDLLRQLAGSLGVGLQGLDEALARATPNNPKWSDVWTQDWANDWLSIRLAFQPLTYFLDDASKGYREMKSHAVLTIEWKPTEVGPTYREKPITPPKGYEHVSMDMPGSDLVKKAQTSDDPSLAHLRYPDEKQRQAIIGTITETVPNPRSKPKAVEATPPPTTNEVSTSSMPWSVVAVLIVAAIGLLWLLVKKRK
ncbi:MAG TPA: hypothetical protein PLB55_05640 [Prosthecobacter sp.]|nr:hypothetical protein [Prosthecobacter sp.]